MTNAFKVLGPLIVLAGGCGLSEIPVESKPSADPVPGAGGMSAAGGGTGGATPVGGSGGGTGGAAGRGGAPGTGGSSGGGGTGRGGTDGGGSAMDTVAPPASGTTVTINGMVLPKEKVLVFLHIGHSNMAGRTTVPQSLRPYNFETDPKLWSYVKGGVWKPAKEPLSADSMTASCGGVGCDGLPAGAGPGMSILRAALAVSPDSYIVSIGRGQSGLTGGYCRSFRKGGLLYDYVMGPAMELKGKVTFAGIWTMFGISEVNDRSNVSRVGDCIVGVANDMRTDLGEPDLPLLVGDWEAEATGGGDVSASSSLAQMIIPQFRMVPMRVPRSLVIPTDGLPTNPRDGYHYDLTGHKLWGERGIALLKMNGWAPWATK